MLQTSSLQLSSYQEIQPSSANQCWNRYNCFSTKKEWHKIMDNHISWCDEAGAKPRYLLLKQFKITTNFFTRCEIRGSDTLILIYCD